MTIVAFARRSAGLRSEGGGMVAVESAIEEKGSCVCMCVFDMLSLYIIISLSFFGGLFGE